MLKEYDGEYVPEDFSYDSGTNEDFLSVDDLRTMIEHYLSK